MVCEAFSCGGSTMTALFTESEIQAILDDPKPITKKQLLRLKRLKRVNAKLSQFVQLRGKSGRKYVLSLRQSPKKPRDFSVILSLMSHGKQVNIIRCNGHHAPHQNPIEGTTIPADTCHIHQITERYQQYPGVSPEHFAVATVAYPPMLSAAMEYASFRFGIFVSDDGHRGGLYREFE
jgi:hypothetical protein